MSLSPGASTTGLLVNIGMEGTAVITGTGNTGVDSVCGPASKEGCGKCIIGVTISGGSVAISVDVVEDSVSVGIEGRGGDCMPIVIDPKATTVGLAAVGAGAMCKGGS